MATMWFPTAANATHIYPLGFSDEPENDDDVGAHLAQAPLPNVSHIYIQLGPRAYHEGDPLHMQSRTTCRRLYEFGRFLLGRSR